jgi:hypothetical protein
MNQNLSVREQLTYLINKEGISLEKLTDLYIREGLVDRFSRSNLNQKYVMKGASVFQILAGKAHRPTKDIDFLGFGTNNPQQLQEEFNEIIKIPLNDGLRFNDISTSILQAGQKYEGVRLDIKGNLEDVPIKGQIDIGFGSVINPQIAEGKFPTLLGRENPLVRHYPKETVVAEKFEAVTNLGIRNSRIKDFYDLLYLARNFEFQGKELSQAIKATFNHRGTEIPRINPVGLTTKFITYRKDRNKTWKKFYAEGAMGERPKFKEAIDEIAEFIMPVSQALAKDRLFNQNWTPRQKWQLPPEFKFSQYQGEMEKIYPLPKSAKEQSTNQSQSKQELD